MLSRLNTAAVVAALFLTCGGCQAVHCGDDCCGKRWQAFSKYDCSCDDCGCEGGRGCATTCGAGCRGGCGQANHRPVLGRLCGCIGCGELYWNEWFNDPPAVCDPCDCCGNYRGPGATCCSAVPSLLPEVESEEASAVPAPLELAPPSDPATPGMVGD